MVKGLLAHTGGLFWNLSADVGPGQPNLPDDVELVRFRYFLMKDNPKATGGPFAVLKPVLQQVTPTGAFDNALAAAIRTHQSLRGGTQDGRVSVAKGQSIQSRPIRRQTRLDGFSAEQHYDRHGA